MFPFKKRAFSAVDLRVLPWFPRAQKGMPIFLMQLLFPSFTWNLVQCSVMANLICSLSVCSSVSHLPFPPFLCLSTMREPICPQMSW